MTKEDARELALDALAQMRLPDPRRIAKSFPGELSGGMCQRIMIAIATTLDPKLLIADEPTASLDVTIQAQILYELERLRAERGTAILLITHDMGIVAQIAERVAVVYAGAIVEVDDIVPLFKTPRHPYTWSLLDSLPRLDRRRRSRLRQIPGAPPDLSEVDEHCSFLPRCPKALTQCRLEAEPLLASLADGGPPSRRRLLQPRRTRPNPRHPAAPCELSQQRLTTDSRPTSPPPDPRPTAPPPDRPAARRRRADTR